MIGTLVYVEMLSWVAYALLVAVTIRWVTTNEMVGCPNPLTADPRRQQACFFSSNYLAARSLFRSSAELAGAKLFALRLSEDLTIDIAVLAGQDPSKVVLHFSGTHGVEGFVGSAIQSATLRYFHLSPALQRDKTIIFVHGLNAYGMAYWRRFNENNVDLNRNALFDDEKFREVLGRDPNIAGYETWTSVLNPVERPSIFSTIMVIFRAGSMLATNSMAAMKRAIVTGTYSQPQGIFYGGSKLQPSHQLVRDFLQLHGFLQSTRNLIVIDVHSGLGPFANDTLMMNEHIEEARMMYQEPNEKVQDLPWSSPFALELQTLQVGKGNFASDGYDLMTGDVQSQYPKLFHALDSAVSVTQEFGTYAAPIVAFQLIRENQAFHYGTRELQIVEGRRLKEIFTPNNQQFAKSVLQRGMILILQSM